MPPLKVYTLGHSGVIIDAAPTEPTLPLDVLTNSQNAIHDPKEGHLGALRKRAGFSKFNIAYAGGPILGGITMPVLGTGGAPAQSPFDGVNNPTGSTAGAGSGSGGAGSSTAGSGGSSSNPLTGASLFNGGKIINGGGPLVAVGRFDSFGNGWYVNKPDLSATDTAFRPASSPQPAATNTTGVPYPPTATFTGAYGKPCVFDPSTAYLFYAEDHAISSSATTSIRKTNGIVDTLVANLAAGTRIIYCMCLSDDGSSLFVGTRDSTGGTGALYRVDKQTGSSTLVVLRGDQSFPGTPYCISTFNGKLWVGEWLQSGNDVGNPQNTQIDAAASQNPAQSSTPLLNTSPSILVNGDISQQLQVDKVFAPSGGGIVTTCLVAFPKADSVNQILFAGQANVSTTFAQVWARQRTGIGDPNGWAASLTPTSGAGAKAGNIFHSLVEFNGKLYVSFRNPNDIARIYALTPDFTQLATDGGWNGSGTWNIVYSVTQAGTFNAYWTLWTNGAYLYALSGSVTGGTNENNALVTTDGLTWTDESANFPHSPNTDNIVPYFIALNQ